MWINSVSELIVSVYWFFFFFPIKRQHAVMKGICDLSSFLTLKMDTLLKLEDCWTGSSLTFLVVYNRMTM